MVKVTGNNWIFGLLSMFGIVILFIIFGMVFNAYLLPAFRESIDNDNIGGAIDDPTKVLINDRYDQFMLFFRISPLALGLIIIIWMIVTAVRKQAESNFGE